MKLPLNGYQAENVLTYYPDEVPADFFVRKIIKNVALYESRIQSWIVILTHSYIENELCLDF